ncbi:MAG: sigma-70 family RNA polymerase sigma factor [Patescibacteria group bacterium]|jgi:RNA polymerase sigma factor (sigma-70 family)
MVLSGEEEREYITKIKTGDEQARAEFIEINIPLVKSIAIRFLRCSSGHSFTLNDLVNEGIIGMIEALNDFDLTRGTKFSTYAVPRIKVAIKRGVDANGYLISVPENKSDKIREKTKKQDFNYGDYLNGDTTEGEWYAFCALQRPIYLDGYGKESEVESNYFLLPPVMPISQSILEKEEDVEIVEKLLKCLTVKQREITGLYAGLDGQPYPLRKAAVAASKGISAVLVNDTILQSIEKMRRAARIMGLSYP